MPTNRRPILRRRVSSVWELNGFQEFSLTHLCRCGYPLGLETNFGPDWEDVIEDAWAIHGERLSEEYRSRHPGERPAAWWEWSCPDDPERLEAETDVQYLYRLGQIDDSELEGIRRKARSLVEYNRGRRPTEPSDLFIPPGDVIRFAANHGLLTAAERAILHLV